jgi:uncharacterized damage-inducible protein DinB
MNLSTEFLDSSRNYLCREYPTKIERCLSDLPADALWRRTDRDSNSIGNLLVHLEGNVRQWILTNIGRQPGTRNRAAEFAATTGGDAPTLLAKLRTTLDEVDVLLASLTEADLGTRRVIQERDVSVLDAIYHVVEHFSMHTGQIILLTKQFAPGTVKFYEDSGGNARKLY